MICLAIEASTNRRSVAVARHGIVLAEAVHTAGRDTPLFGMIESALAKACLRPEQVSHLAVGLGPGSYTGIRIAIAAAQGWALAHPVRLVGRSSVDLAARRARNLALHGPTTVVVDAHRGEIYLADFTLTPDAIQPISPLRIASRAEVEAARAAGHRIVGPDLDALAIPGQAVFPEAATLASWICESDEATAPELLEPIYLRSTAFIKAPPPRAVPAPPAS